MVAKLNMYIFSFDLKGQAEKKQIMVVPLQSIGFPSTNTVVALGNLGQMITLFLWTAFIFAPL
jgi:hypothetical protein